MPSSSSSGSSTSRRSVGVASCGRPRGAQKIGRAPLETGHGWPAGSIGRPQRGHSGRPAVSTVSACFEKATTWLVAEPEADARARRPSAAAPRSPADLARDQHEHLAALVVAEAHLADLPLGLAGLQAPAVAGVPARTSIPCASIIWCRRTIRAWICAFSQVSVSVRPWPVASRKNWRWPGSPTAATAIAVDRVELVDGIRCLA